MPDHFTRHGKRLPPGPLGEAIDHALWFAHLSAHRHEYLDTEDEAVTKVLDLLAPLQRSHDAMEALRAREFHRLLHGTAQVWIYGPDLADAILAAAKGRGETAVVPPKLRVEVIRRIRGFDVYINSPPVYLGHIGELVYRLKDTSNPHYGYRYVLSYKTIDGRTDDVLFLSGDLDFDMIHTVVCHMLPDSYVQHEIDLTVCAPVDLKHSEFNKHMSNGGRNV